MSDLATRPRRGSFIAGRGRIVAARIHALHTRIWFAARNGWKFRATSERSMELAPRNDDRRPSSIRRAQEIATPEQMTYTTDIAFGKSVFARNLCV
jgi:hypothetical protein